MVIELKKLQEKNEQYPILHNTSIVFHQSNVGCVLGAQLIEKDFLNLSLMIYVKQKPEDFVIKSELKHVTSH